MKAKVAPEPIPDEARMRPMRPTKGVVPMLALLALWGLFTLAALWARPLVPVDETRYAAVAWEMWSRADWLLPYLNGAPYAQKPPLLFWLINLGWAAFGVTDWLPRLLPAAATLVDLWLLHRLERALWPGEAAGPWLAPWLFYGCFYVVLFSTFLMFDLLMTTAVLIGLIGLVRAARQDGPGGWALYALGIGLGALTKGPVILLYLLPVAVLGPWWRPGRRTGGPARWYRHLGLALLAGAALALGWAIPAAVRGGPEYREMILWGQTAGRLTTSFAHARPWWWYLPFLPVILLPWSLWLPWWRALAALSRDFGAAERFCVACVLPPLLAFSAISGKQVHYLMPLLPALMLLASRALRRAPLVRAGRGAVALVLAPWLVLAVAVAGAPRLAAQGLGPAWLAQVSPGWAVALAVLVLLSAYGLRTRRANAWLAVMSVLFGLVLHVGVVRDAARPAFDARPLARQIAALQAQGLTVAYAGKYHGDFQFAGRLREPLVPIVPGTEVAWAQAHPAAALVVRHRSMSASQRSAAVFAQPYRGREVALWRAATLLERPDYAADAAGKGEEQTEAGH